VNRSPNRPARARRPAKAAAPARAAPGRVRIIGGQYKRTPITVIDAPGLRPTPDRVRETLFNWLEHLLGGDWSRVEALDLFAGSGALGFECASRGARRVVLVEQRKEAAAALRALRERLHCAAVDVVEGEALTAAARLPGASLDLVLLDPPFGSGLLAPALAAAARLLRPGGLIYAEAQAPLGEEDGQALGLEPVRTGQAGAVHFHLLRARSC
jgi:16S rRNA (guanine(966)-N(2))-methyltransferase RsmD